MQTQNRRVIIWVNVVLEFLLILIAYRLSVFIRFSLMDGFLNEAMTHSISRRLIFCYSIVVVCIYWMAQLYAPVFTLPIKTELLRVLLINLFCTVSLGFSLFLFRITDFSRIALALFFIVSTIIICTKRIVIHIIIRRQVLSGARQRHIILIGSGNLAQQYIEDISYNPHLGFVIDGYIGASQQQIIGTCLGEIEDLGRILEKYPLDQVVVALDPSETAYIQPVLEAVEKEGLPVSMIPFYSEFFPSHPTFESFGKTKLVNLRATPLNNIALAVLKRVVDIFGSALLIVLFKF